MSIIPVESLQRQILHFYENPYEKLPDYMFPKIPEGEQLPYPSLPPEIGQLHRGEPFRFFLPRHMNEAMKLVDYLMGCDKYKQFMFAAAHCRQIVNEHMFIYALSVVLVHRRDTRSLRLPPLYQVYPDKFIDQELLFKIQKEVQHGDPQSTRIEVKLDFSGTNRDIEQRIAYFREDIAYNSHHWHWHLIYPYSWQPSENRPIKDRKGELFYYMHQQMLARYESARFSADMERTIPLLHWTENILEGYHPHLFFPLSGREYGTRPRGLTLKDTGEVSLEDLGVWKSRILEVIDTGRVLMPDGTHVALQEGTGIDILGSIVESSAVSPNPNYYGNIHNMGHDLISLMHDPDGRLRAFPGVMGFGETAARDPVFYRWHRFTDNIFQLYKESLPPYTDQQLTWDEISIDNVEVITTGKNHKPNTLYTFFQEKKLDISRGLDFNLRGIVQVTFTHLQHEGFKYVISVINTSQILKVATVRIFMAPKYNDLLELPSANEHRGFFFELDKFQIQLKPGINEINRASIDSSISMPPEQTWEELINIPIENFDPDNDNINFCGCGWPDHLLIPRGKPGGMEFKLFVMLTNFQDDEVAQLRGKHHCSSAHSYCGSMNDLYPDRRAMGFPFDRRIDTLSNVTFYQRSNMSLTDVVIFDKGIKRDEN